MSTPIDAHANVCVVCSHPLDESYTSGGQAMMVLHPGQAQPPCGNWIHENCRYRGDQAPVCPCGADYATEGCLPSAFGPQPSDDSEEEISDEGDGARNFNYFDEANAEVDPDYSTLQDDAELDSADDDDAEPRRNDMEAEEKETRESEEEEEEED